MKKLIILLIMLISCFSVKPQNFLYSNNGKFKYNYGTSEPDTNWRKIDYNDFGWLSGNGTIGYGDGDDSTVINKTGSVYLRIKFEINDKSKIKDLNFGVDYDDAFVAYLNGTEIARSPNLGKPGENIPFNRLADFSHEAVAYRPYNHNYVYGFYIDSTTTKKCLQNGTNVISVQVHNDSINGSDLTFNSNIYDCASGPYKLNVGYERYIKHVSFDSSYIPIIKINTNEYGVIGNSVAGHGNLGIIYHGAGKLNKVNDNFLTYIGNISIKMRGNISEDGSKKNYAIELQDIAGNDSSVSLLGMPKESDWILYGPYYDKSLIRNELAMIFGRNLGHYEPRTKWCELVLNNEFLGLYLLVEKIKRDAGRVNVTKMYPSDTTGVAVTGGYILKYDKDWDRSITFVYPGEPNLPQRKYVSNFFSHLYKLLDSVHFADKNKGYRKYVDAQSLIDYVIVNELVKNCDSYKYSSYMYKDMDDVDGRLKYGPLWDNDLAFGNGVWQNGYKTEGWQFAQEENNYMYIHKFMADTSLVHQLSQKWKILRKNIFSWETIENTIDSLENILVDARIRNNDVYMMENKNIWASWSSGDVNPSSSFQEDLDNMKIWIQKRLAWIDDNIDAIYFKAPTIVENTFFAVNSFNVYPNPFKEDLELTINASAGKYSMQICDLYGRIILLKEFALTDGSNKLKVSASELDNLNRGMYILSVLKDGRALCSKKVVKK